ncbi:MAG: TIR domain-containing protein [Pseudonocardiaceae bacterium]
MLEAERRGDVDDILDQAQRYLKGDPITTNISTAPETEGIRRLNNDQYIFISHASADKQLADLLQDMLVLGGVPQGRIFYSSARATGIPSGEDFRSYLQKTLRKSALAIELISEAFLQRPVCLIELGGAWALGTATYPIVIPPLSRDEASKHIGALHMGLLGDSHEIDSVFDELDDRIAQTVALSLKATAWNNAVRRFKSQFPHLLSNTVSITTAPIKTAPPKSDFPPTSQPENMPKISLTNEVAVPSSYGTEVHGEATNNDAFEHTASIKATFYGPDGKIIGTADGLANQIGSGQTKTYTLTSDKVMPSNARLKVQVDTIF